MSTTPFSIAISPGRLAPIHGAGSRTLEVWNVGSQPVTLAGRIFGDVKTSHGCGIGPSVTWASVSPVTVTLQPHAHEAVTLRVTGAPGGTHGLVIAYQTVNTAAQDGTHVGVAGAVGSQVEVTGSGKAQTQAACASIAVPKAPPASGAFPTLPVAGGGAVALACVLALFLLPLRHRGRRARTGRKIARHAA